MSSNSNDNKNHLAEYLSFESSRQKSQQKQRSSDNDHCNHNNNNNNDDITRHALNQLIESKLGTEITWCAQRLVDNNNNNDGTNNNNDGSSRVMEEEVVRLMETSAYQQTITAQIQQCPMSLLLPTESAQHATNNDVNEKDNNMESSNTKPTAVPPMSFSLFDLMDSQQLSMLPPRIMAQQIIDAYHCDCKTNNSGGNNGSDNNSSGNSIPDNDATYPTAPTTSNNDQKTALELLEEAEDMEDLSPDVDSWEQIRCIVYRGLIFGANSNTTTTTNNSSTIINNNSAVKEQRLRYFNVNKSLFDKCIKGSGAIMMLRCQTWGLTYNIIGSILYQSLYLVTCQQDTNYGDIKNSYNNNNNNIDLDLYWDSCYHLLTSLSQLSKEYITSCIGYETEIERMIMGLSYILCTDVSSCVMAMMEPMAGYFEIWTRFVKPDRLLSILRVTGLGETMLHRCECRGQNESTKRLHELIVLHHCQERGDDETTACSTSTTTTLQDLENANFIQSLSILRVILFRCNVTSSERLWSIFATGDVVTTATPASSFLMADGIVSSEEVQSILDKAKDYEQEDSTEKSRKDVKTRLLKPFCDVVRLSKSNPDLVSDNLEMLCTQTISLIEKL